MIKLSQAGYGSFDVTPVVSAAELKGRTLEIISIETATTRYGEALCFHVKDMDSGEDFKVFMGVTEKRLALKKYLEENPGQHIGPVGVEKRGNFYIFYEVPPVQHQLPFEPPEVKAEVA